MVACPSCDADVQNDDRFCASCGAEVTEVRVLAGSGRPIAELRVTGFATHDELAARAPALRPNLTAESGYSDQSEDDEVRRGLRRAPLGVVLGSAAAAVILVATAVIALIASNQGSDEPEAGTTVEHAPAAEIEVPATAPDSADNAGERTSYRAGNLVDGDPATAWRMRGSGKGEQIVLTWPEPVTITEVGLVNGYAKVDDLGEVDRYRQNRRIAEVTWRFDDGTESTQRFESSTELQTLTLDTPITTDRLRIRLDQVSRSGGRNFTAISEIRVTGT